MKVAYAPCCQLSCCFCSSTRTPTGQWGEWGVGGSKWHMYLHYICICMYISLGTGNVTICSFSFWPQHGSLSLSVCSFCEVFVGGAVFVLSLLQFQRPNVLSLLLVFGLAFQPQPQPQPESCLLLPIAPIHALISQPVIAANNLPMLVLVLECLMRVLVSTSPGQGPALPYPIYPSIVIASSSVQRSHRFYHPFQRPQRQSPR